MAHKSHFKPFLYSPLDRALINFDVQIKYSVSTIVFLAYVGPVALRTKLDASFWIYANEEMNGGMKKVAFICLVSLSVNTKTSSIKMNWSDLKNQTVLEVASGFVFISRKMINCFISCNEFLLRTASPKSLLSSWMVKGKPFFFSPALKTICNTCIEFYLDLIADLLGKNKFMFLNLNHNNLSTCI